MCAGRPAGSVRLRRSRRRRACRCVRWASASLGRASVDPAHHGPHHRRHRRRPVAWAPDGSGSRGRPSDNGAPPALRRRAVPVRGELPCRRPANRSTGSRSPPVSQRGCGHAVTDPAPTGGCPASTSCTARTTSRRRAGSRRSCRCTTVVPHQRHREHRRRQSCGSGAAACREARRVRARQFARDGRVGPRAARHRSRRGRAPRTPAAAHRRPSKILASASTADHSSSRSARSNVASR